MNFGIFLSIVATRFRGGALSVTGWDLERKADAMENGQRFFVNIPHADNYRIILHLRDPRDVLVSMFYSYCYIHPGEVQANTGYRRAAAARAEASGERGETSAASARCARTARRARR